MADRCYSARLRNTASARETWLAMALTHPTRVDGYDAIRLRSASAPLDATFVPGEHYTATFSITVERP